MRWVQLCCSFNIIWHCLSLGLEWKLTFSSPVAPAEFSNLWHIECSTFTASSFRIWSSTEFLSPPLALFKEMLPKRCLTSHSRMTSSRWLITPLWLSGSWRSFLYSYLFSCHLFLISSASLPSYKKEIGAGTNKYIHGCVSIRISIEAQESNRSCCAKMRYWNGRTRGRNEVGNKLHNIYLWHIWIQYPKI